MDASIGRLKGLLPRGRWARALTWIGGAFAVALVAAVLLEPVVERRLRATTEREMNERLDGYTVSIGGLELRLLGFGIDLEDLVLVQARHSEPPVASIPVLSGSLHWRALLRGAVVADVEFEAPRLHVDRRHLAEESADEVPVEKRGWQDALRAVYFDLEINELRIDEGRLTYVHAGRLKPLELSRVHAHASNIRNIDTPDAIYPSTLSAEAVVFDSGALRLDGRADFLAEPHPGTAADIVLEDVPLGYFAPIVDRYNLRVREGTLSARGEIEYAPQVKRLHLTSVTLQEPRVDFVHTAGTADAERRTARRVGRAARTVVNEPDVLMRVDRLSMQGGEIGFVNRATDPDYRVYIGDTRLTIEHLTNQQAERPATVRLAGQFMGSGRTQADATFRPAKTAPALDLSVRIENTDLRAMNDLLRAHGKVDVADGRFFLYSELAVKDREIRGYVKPFFRNVDVYDSQQDREKSLGRKLYEGAVGALSGLLENPREEVATKADVFGRIEDPDTSTWQIIVRIVRNAFFRAILPGFEREARARDSR